MSERWRETNGTQNENLAESTLGCLCIGVAVKLKSAELFCTGKQYDGILKLVD